MNNLPACPHCGVHPAMFVRNVRVYGWIQELYNPDGTFDSVENDHQGYSNPRVIRCADCMAIRSDVQFTTEFSRFHGFAIIEKTERKPKEK